MTRPQSTISADLQSSGEQSLWHHYKIANVVKRGFESFRAHAACIYLHMCIFELHEKTRNSFFFMLLVSGESNELGDKHANPVAMSTIN